MNKEEYPIVRSPYSSRIQSLNEFTISSEQKAETTSFIIKNYAEIMTPTKNMNVYINDECVKSKQLLESELVKLTLERDTLRKEYQKLPIYGGKMNAKHRSEQIEQSLDERESGIASVKKKIKEMGAM